MRYWHVATLAGVIGLVNALDMPSRQSFLVEMVGREDLLNGIALNSATFNSARVVGPALGGLLIARYGTAVAFLLNALSFLAVVLNLAAVRVGLGGEAAARHDDPRGARWTAFATRRARRWSRSSWASSSRSARSP